MKSYWLVVIENERIVVKATNPFEALEKATAKIYGNVQKLEWLAHVIDSD